MAIKTDKSKVTKAELHRTALANPPSRFLDYKDFLGTLFATLKRRYTGYTYQSFSADLGFPTSNVAYIVIHGFRPLTEARAETIIKALDLRGVERKYFLELLLYTDSASEEERTKRFRALVDLKSQAVGAPEDKLSLEFFSHWFHAAIFELAGLEKYKADPAWIAEQFHQKVSVRDIEASLALLERLGLIRYDETLGRHVKATQSISLGDDVRGFAAVGYHLQMMELGRAALSRVPHDEREIGAVTLAVTSEIAERLREDLLTLKRYAVFMADQCKDPERVVQLNFQLFPLTKE